MSSRLSPELASVPGEEIGNSDVRVLSRLRIVAKIVNPIADPHEVLGDVGVKMMGGFGIQVPIDDGSCVL